MNRYNFILILFISSCWFESCSTSNKPGIETPQIPIVRVDDQNILFNPCIPEDIKKHDVKQLIIQNCLSYNICFRDVYWFNACGEVELHDPPMVASIYKFSYDSDCKLKRMSAGHSDFQYSYLENDSIQEDIYDNIKDTVSTLVYSNRFKLSTERNPTSIYNHQGEVIEEHMRDLIYPCGIEFYGNYRSEHNYHDNGLKDYVSIYDSLDSLVIELEYSYFDENELALNFNK